jgi:hypothetical protein
MTSLKDLLKNIRIQVKKSPQKIAQELNDPTGNEYGFRHSNGAFMLCRDDKVVELNAGHGAAVVVDGPGQMVNIKATGVTLDSQTVQFKVPPGNVYFGYQPLNPFWLTTNPLDFISPFIKAPLYSRVPVPPDGAVVPGLAINPLDLIYVSATPALPVETPAGPGLATGLVPLSTYLAAQPLFGMNQQLHILSRNVGEVIKNLTLIGA